VLGSTVSIQLEVVNKSANFILNLQEQSDGHSDKVSSLAWGSTSTLFSGGADGFTIEWDVTTRKQLR